MMKKRITAIITAIMMLTTLIPMTFAGVANAAAVAPDGKAVLADFSGGVIPSGITVKNRFNNNSTAAGIDNTVSYEGTSSLSYTFDSTESHIIIPYNSAWGTHDTFNMRVYAERPNQIVNFIINDTAEASSSKDNNYYSTKHTFNGSWQTFSVNVSEIQKRWILDGNKKPIAPENIYILLNCSGWNISPGTVDQLGTSYTHSNGQKYTYGSVKGEKFYIDSIWLGKSDFGGNMSVTNTSISHGEGNIPANLDGNNTFTMSFDKALWDTDYSETVKVYEIEDGSETLTDASYQISVSGNDLNVTFDSELPMGDYKVTLDSSAFWGENGEKLSSDLEYIFSVEKGSVFFLVTSHTIPDGATDIVPEAGLSYTVEFNNNLDTTGGVDNFVTITENGTELGYDDYEISCTGKVMTITINKELTGSSTYKITLSSEICDEYTQYLDEDIVYSFKTAKTPTRIGADGVAFDARNRVDLEEGLLGGGMTLSISDENPLIGDSSLKIAYKAGQDRTTTVSPRLGDITGYTYVNWLIYSPKNDGEGMRLMIGTERGDPASGKDSYFLYTGKTDWQGWKVLTIPIAEMSNNRKADKTKVTGQNVNFGGWNDKRSEDGYILVDRVWYTNEIPSAPELDSTEYEYEQAYVPSDLGGDNAFGFTFSKELLDKDYSDAVSIYEYDGSDFVYSDVAFETEVDSNVLNIRFISGVDNGDTYKICVDSGKIISSDVSFGAGECETVFTVGTGSPYFRVIGNEFEKAQNSDENDTFTLEFNNEPENVDVSDYISVYADGKKVYNTFKGAKDGKKLVLTFKEALEDGVRYTLKISNDYTDVYSSKITGETEFAVYYKEAAKSGDSLVVFSANNDTDFNSAIKNGGILEEVNETNLYSRTARLNFTAGKDVSRYPMYLRRTDITGMNYMNMWVYAPKATGYPIGIIVYNDMAGKKYKYHSITGDWEGWKLISIENTLLGGHSSIETININMGGWTTKDQITEDTYLLVDEIWFSKNALSGIEYVGANVPEGYDSAAISGEVIKFEFSEKLGNNPNAAISVTDEAGNAVEDYTVSCEGKFVVFTFGTLSANTKYNINISGLVGEQPISQKNPVEFSFTTEDAGIYVTSVTASPDSVMQDVIMNVEFNVSNFTASDAKLKAHVYVTDEDGRVLDYITEEFTAAQGVSTAAYEVYCYEGASLVTAYVTDEAGNVVSDKYVTVTEYGTQTDVSSDVKGSSKEVKISEASLNVNVLEIKGKVSGTSGTVRIEIKGDSILSSGLAGADKNGNFEYYYVFTANDKSGSYIINAYADGCESSKEITYASKADRDVILSLANGSSAKNLADTLKEMKTALGIDATDEEIEDISENIIDRDKFNSYTDVFELIKRLINLLDEINASKWSTISEIVLSNKDVWGEDNSDIKYMEKLSEKGRNKIGEILVKKLPAATLSDFADKLSDAVDDYKKSLKDDDKSTGGGGGGGGGKTTSSANYPTGSAGPVPYTPIEANNVFTDLTDAAWARDSVMTLYKEGIVSYPADGRFRPDDKITREEFVKMVVCAFVENVSYSNHRFSDEAEGAWYNEYLSKAYAAGITAGYPDGRFGVGENITREDMVTICARTLESLGYTMTSNYDGGFSDSAQISDYALGYIGALTQTGVINGMGDGSFAPKANATRAQAAKIIAGLIELY